MLNEADQYAKGVDAAEEALPGIKNDLLLRKESLSPENRCGGCCRTGKSAEQLGERSPKADKGNLPGAAYKKRQQKRVCGNYRQRLRGYEGLKRVTEDSALVSLRLYGAEHGRDMMRFFMKLPRSIGKAGLQRSGH